MKWRLRQTVHSSWLVALVCAGFVGGVAAALVWRVSFFWGIAGATCVIGGFVIGRVYMLPVMAVASFVFGVAFGSAHSADRSRYELWIGREVKLKGKVREDPSKSPSGSISLQLDTVSINSQALPGAVFVSARGARDVKRGDIVEATTTARPGFANFPLTFSVVRFDSLIRPPNGDVGRVVRDWFADHVRKVIPEPQASLGIGFLTGQKSALSADLSDALKIAGLTHIVVASGYNLTILVRMARKLFLKFSKFLSAVSSSVMIMAFMAITGLSPSMTRAGLVSGMSLLAWYYGHAFHPFVLLPFAAALTVAFQPSYVWGDLGWQLSFSAFAGVMIVAPLLQAYFFGAAEPSVFRQILGETLAAHSVTVPIIALGFGVVSNVAVIANMLVVPLVPLAMLLTFICGLAVIVAIPLGVVAFIAEPTSWLLGYMVHVATYVSEIPWAQSELSGAPIIWCIYIGLLAVACWWMWRKSGYNFRSGEQVQY